MKEILDIGAGESPIPTATIAVDVNKPAKIPKRIAVKIGPGASKIKGLPLNLPPRSKLKGYYVGNASTLPPYFDDRFDKVHSNSSVGIFPNVSTKKMGRQIEDVLKPGGSVEIIANAAPALTAKKQILNSKKQRDKVVSMLKAGNLRNIKMNGNLRTGDLAFTATKSFDRGTRLPKQRSYGGR